MLDLSETLFFSTECRNGGRHGDYKGFWIASITDECQKTQIMGKRIKLTVLMLCTLMQCKRGR